MLRQVCQCGYCIHPTTRNAGLSHGWSSSRGLISVCRYQVRQGADDVARFFQMPMSQCLSVASTDRNSEDVACWNVTLMEGAEHI